MLPSFTDTLTTIVLGAVGSLIAAFLFSRAPIWASSAATWWANRSRQRAMARLAKLQLELKRLDSFMASSATYFGWLAASLSRICIGLALIIIGFSEMILDLSAKIAIKTNAEIDATHLVFDSPHFQLLISLTFNAAILVGMIIILLYSSKIHQNFPLTQRKAFLEQQIRSLVMRHPQPA